MEELIHTITTLLDIKELPTLRAGQKRYTLNGGEVYLDKELTKHVARISELADEYLIDSDGDCNWTNHRLLEERIPGVRIGPGEKDSFGWLIGIIYTPKGDIVFG